MVACLKTFVVK